MEAEVVKQEQAVVKQTVSYQKTVRQAGKKPVRQSFPDHLPRIDVVLEPEEDISTMRKVGEEVTEELDLEPARLFVRRYIRPRYVSTEESFHIAELPARPIENRSTTEAYPAQDCWHKFL